MNFLDSLKTKIQNTISRFGENFSTGYKQATEPKVSTPITSKPTVLPVFDAIQKSIPKVVTGETAKKFEQKVELAKKEEESFNKPFASAVMDSIQKTHEGIIKYGFDYPSRIIGGRIAGGLETSPTKQFDFSSISALKKSIESQPTAFEAIQTASGKRGLPAPVGVALGFIAEALIPGPAELNAITKPSVLKSLAKETDEGVIKNILVKEAKLGEEQATAISREVAPLKTEKEIMSVLKPKEQQIVTPKAEMLERVKKATEEAEPKFIADREKVIAKNQGVITEEVPSFWRKAKETLNPFKYQDEPIKEAWQKNVASRSLANEKANEEFLRLADIPEKEGLKTIFDYQAGVKTAYSEKIKEVFDSLFKEANARGLETKYIENYIPQVYANTKEEVITALTKFMKAKNVPDSVIADYLQGIPLPKEYSGALKMSPSFVKERAFPDYKTAMEFGLTPKYSNPAQLAGHYRSEMEKSLANRELIDTLKKERAIHPFKMPGDKAVDLPFSTEELYAKPKMAEALNKYFRDEDNLGVGEQIFKATATLSRRMQELVLSGGVPSTNINFFTIGQGVKSLTAAEKSVLGNLARSNFDDWSIGWFRANQSYITKMAEEGLDVSGRIGNWDKVYNQLSSKKGFSRILEKSGQKFDDLFNKKTFQSFMPMQSVSIFKNTYDSAIEKGLSAEEARKLAGNTTKAWTGAVEDWGRGKTTQDAINSIFFAPRFREGLINLFGNTVKSLSTEIANPAFARNRKFVLGAALSYAGYNLLNKKLNGNYMWENEAGKEFDLKIPLGDGKFTYIAFLPSVTAFPRNMISGAIALSKLDTETAGQKFGSLFSMPIKLATEVASNKDYFGRPIWDVDSTRIQKLRDIAKYIGIDQYNHPYVQAVYNLTFAPDGKKKDWYEVMSRAAELPLKFNKQSNIDLGKYYDAMDEQQVKRDKALEPVREIYDRFQTMKANGQEEEAKKMYAELPDNVKQIYQDIRQAEKTKATKALKAKMYPLFLQMQELKQSGKIEEAKSIYAEFTAEEKRIYQLLKNQFKSYE